MPVTTASSSSASEPGTLTEFTKFNDLPKEIRLMIWRLELPGKSDVLFKENLLEIRVIQALVE